MLSGCNAGGFRADWVRPKLSTPALALRSAPRVTLLSIESEAQPTLPTHFVRAKQAFSVDFSLRDFRAETLPQPQVEPSAIRPASTTTTNGQVSHYARPIPSAQTFSLPHIEFPAFARHSALPGANDFYVTIGTGIADPEKDPSWTSAAVYPMESTSGKLPAIQIIGQTSREEDLMQFAPGFFWWASTSCCVSLALPLGVTDSAPEWGVLLALIY